MDTSETYIKMCEKAEEIQKVRGDYANEFTVAFCSGKITRGLHASPIMELESCCIWLPCQAQLQEMLPQYSFMELLAHFFEACADGKLTHFETWEQAWCTFVMKEKYNKAWDGERWNNG